MLSLPFSRCHLDRHGPSLSIVVSLFCQFAITTFFVFQALRYGHLWYLNVHAEPPYRWQRCEAVLYPSAILLWWIAPGGGRGVVTLDLVNCNEVRSVPSPSHPSARDDVGTIAAREQMAEQGASAEWDLVEMLCPFQLLYSDGVERLGAESARERVRWVSAIWFVVLFRVFLFFFYDNILIGRLLIGLCRYLIVHKRGPRLDLFALYRQTSAQVPRAQDLALLLLSLCHLSIVFQTSRISLTFRHKLRLSLL